MTTTITTQHDGRTYELTCDDNFTRIALRAHLLAQGFDGNSYTGVSYPVGRQRKAFTGLFFRSKATGEFVKAI